MSNPTLDIGLEIKILRERLKISSKDLASRIGLSQSQMSRLEKGQRRIDIRILHRISEALGVEPSFFLRSLEEKEPDREPGGRGQARSAENHTPPLAVFSPPLPYDHLGKLVRSERRKRHLTVDELAVKVGRTKAYMAAFEEGRHPLDSELAERICKVLKLSPSFFVEAQANTVKVLETQVARLNQALAEVHRGLDRLADGDAGSAGAGKRKVPLLGSLGTRETLIFDSHGQPVGEPEDFLLIPGFEAGGAFAMTVAGDAMESPGYPSFREGDVVVFKAPGVTRSRDLALVRLPDDTLLFRQVFFDADGNVRLQPLNLNQTPKSFRRQEILGFWNLALHIARS